ncbi:MAG: helix-turn-helix domain-containing protein [Anaerolineae bacterium]|nr:helix-turn-helix domain-containing protein [Anaerolineae bacterium]
MTNLRHLTASQASQELGISVSTLYAYVSRGLIHSEPSGDEKRSRRYLREDVERLKTRKEQRRNPAKSAEAALNWGEPVLESAITLIENGQLYFRGRDAVALANHQSLEEVAGLIWLGELGAVLFEGDLPEKSLLQFSHLAGLTPIEKFQTVLSIKSGNDLLAYDLSTQGVARTGGRILQFMAEMAIPANGKFQDSVATTLVKGWGLDGEVARKIINLALVLCTDHELNVSSFTARCVASAGSSPYAVVVAGLAALQGYKHGGATAKIEAFLNELKIQNNVRATIAARIKRGEHIPGFGHKLYPKGDPRGKAILAICNQYFPESGAMALGKLVMDEMEQIYSLQPTVDFGLVILSDVLELPPGSALTLFALGRTVGWIGQAIEQYEIDALIRPRARYTGVIPKMDGGRND